MVNTEIEKRRRFWGRVAFALGILWGVLPFISLPMLVFAMNGNTPGMVILASALNGITMLPASALAFWSRKNASWWLIADGVVLAYTGFSHMIGGQHFLNLMLAIGAPLLLGCFGLFSENQGWPALLEAPKAKGGKFFPPPVVEDSQDQDVV